MHSLAKLVAAATQKLNSQIAPMYARPAVPARLLAALLEALHQSRACLATRELHRYRHLLQDDQALTVLGAGMRRG